MYIEEDPTKDIICVILSIYYVTQYYRDITQMEDYLLCTWEYTSSHFSVLLPRDRH